MSDEKTTPDAPATPAAPASTVKAPPSILSRPTDAVARPGFRNPPNARTKAQKAEKGKKKR